MMLALARHSSNDLRQMASEQHEPMQEGEITWQKQKPRVRKEPEITFPPLKSPIASVCFTLRARLSAHEALGHPPNHEGDN